MRHLETTSHDEAKGTYHDQDLGLQGQVTYTQRKLGSDTGTPQIVSKDNIRIMPQDDTYDQMQLVFRPTTARR